MTRPRATYRLQLQPTFDFDDAATLASYLARLGVSHLYASPYLQAAPGSTHGYDVIDHSRVNEELGGAEGHDRMCRALGEAGLGQVLDIVPNHMAVVKGNAWWWDVLENGPSSLYASYFDVDWDPPEAKLRNRVLMAILGDHYGRVLEAGQLVLGREGGSFTVGYFDQPLPPRPAGRALPPRPAGRALPPRPAGRALPPRPAGQVLPIAPRSLDDLLLAASKRCTSVELESLATAFGRLPPSWATDLESVRERHRDKEVLRARLDELCQAEPAVADAVDAEVADINADPDALDALLERQNYRLAHWRTAGWELDYRRFFDISTLGALRVEDDHVFYDTHGLVLDWLAQGVIDGLRIDHPDGLRDPEGYLRKLHGEAPPGTFVVVEKILEPGEELPPPWPVAGTTGYDFTNRATGLFVDPAGEDSLTRAYTAFTKEPAEWAEVVWEKKHLVMREVLSSEVERLTALAVKVCEGHRRYRDYTRHDLHEVITELTAAFPVYRTYVVPGTPPSPADTAHVMTALEATKARRPELDAELCDFLGELVLGRHRGPAEEELVTRFQQLTGPVMAKGVEDTAFYTYNRLVALNEVGGDPGRFGTSAEEFHRTNADTASAWPETLLATSTHDTKRSEDIRARIALLSEIPEDFAEAVARWSSLNKAHRSPTLRDRNMEWLLYQTLVGAWPLPLDRARAYAEKAAKEAKVHTSWVDPNPAYDRALRIFVERLYGNEEFQADLGAFAASLVIPGRVNSLAQTALRLTCPGVPDTYQGTELWDLSLVDPDNRRPVDWELRRRLLDEAEQLSPAQAWARGDEGLPKLLLVQRTLRLRWRRPECFAGSYEPLWAEGEQAPHLVAFARGGEVVTAVPRLVMGLGGDWADTTLPLPPGRWADALDGGERTFEGAVAVADLLAPFPVAILERV